MSDLIHRGTLVCPGGERMEVTVADKMRVHILAKQLNVPSKAILKKCAAEGLPVKNHMTALGPGLEATIREWFSDGQHATTIETADRVDLKKVRIRRKAHAVVAGNEQADRVAEAEGDEQAIGVAEAPTELVPETAPAVAEAPPAEEPPAAEPPAAELPPAEPAAESEREAVAPVAEQEPPVMAEQAVEVDAEVPPAEAEEPGPEPAVAEAVTADTEVPAEPEAPAVPAAGEVAGEETPETLAAAAAAAPEPPGDAEPPADDVPPSETGEEGEEEEGSAEPIRPAGPQNVPAPAKLKGPRVVRYEAPERDYHPPPRSPRRRPAPAAAPPGTARPEELAPAARGGESPGGRKRGAGPADRRRGKPTTAATPRRTTHHDSAAGAAEKLREWRDRDLIERRERLAGATGRKIHRRRTLESQAAAARPGTVARKTTAQVHEPVSVKALCAAVGIPFIKIMRMLQREHNLVVNINSSLSNEVAELIAVDAGIELEIIKAKTQLDVLKEEFASRTPKKPATRPPVVTLLGHVDHGKTSLLDRIRRSRVAKGEDGGITQHIGAYHFKRGDVAVTFLDTPGHEAFTAMRGRGAQLTDVVVLIVAADDGIMPQTVEAISHAKAAEVPIVVAITKTDLGPYDENKLFGQLAEHGLTPSGDWGGEIDVIRTSAMTGEGIDELLEHLSTFAELHEFKADYAGDPLATVIEAETKEGVGAVVRVLVQEGKLRPGQTVVCGNAFGKVRALVDDQGQRMREAGPSIPCEVWGLDEVPSAGDRLYGLRSLQQAKAIAEEVRQERLSRSRVQTQKARSLEDVFKQRDADGIPELNVIIRADVDGSIDAMRHALSKLPTEQVNLAIRHAGVGAVTDGDVLLADASNAIIIAFRVAPMPTTRRLAEEHGVDVREYKVIYNVIEDIVKAMEGLLAPEERRETRGSLEVRQVFKVGRVGTVAGCYVTDGVIARDHRVRLLRDGVVVRAECEIASLRRFKDDAREVRQGMECGVRLEGFDDIKEGDVLEAYEIVKIARTL